MKSIRRRAAVAVLTVAALALAGCAGTATGGASTPAGTYNVYMSMSVTSAISAVAKANIAGMQAAVDAINDEGGIDGRTVKLTVSDDKLDPTTALTELQQAISAGHIDLAIAGNTSNISLALAPVLARNKILTFEQASSTALDDPTKFPYLFQATTSEKFVGQALTTYVQKKGYKKVGLLLGNDALGQDSQKIYTADLEKAGIQVVAESFAPTDLDMTAQLERLRDANPDVVVANAFGAALGIILKNRTTLGWTTPVIGGAATANGNNLGAISTAADWKNMVLEAYLVNTQKGATKAPVQDFIARLKKAGVDINTNLHQYSLMWDVLHIVKAASEKAGTTDTVKVAKAIETYGDFSGKPGAGLSFGVEKFSSTDHSFQWTSAQLSSDVFVFGDAGPLVDGVLEPPSS
jgi:branched-chain amino acid transport system substrate-binding protein